MRVGLIPLFCFMLFMENLSSGAQTAGSYAQVNGISMYYEIHGKGQPLVLIHGGGSTINTSFSRVLPLLAETHQVIAVELQAHGHSSDRDAPESFEQDADDIAALLAQLKVAKADLFGFSNGGNTAMQVATRHPSMVRKLVLASSFYKRSGMYEWFWEGMKHAKFSDMPQVYKDEFLKINPDTAALLNMFHKDASRMQDFKDWTEETIRSIKSPALVVVGDRDVVKPEHAAEMYRLLPVARLAIFPSGHGDYLGEAMSVNPESKLPLLFTEMVNEFLADPVE
jgi:pimeloyl-ACP methyl ester carboxylesterase